jgi:hypothetical protein
VPESHQLTSLFAGTFTTSRVATRLAVERVRRRGFFDLAQVRDIRERCSGPTPHPEATMRLWTLIAAEIWVEQFLDNRGKRPDNYRGDIGTSARLMITKGRGSRISNPERGVAAAMTPSSALSSP